MDLNLETSEKLPKKERDAASRGMRIKIMEMLLI